MEELVYESIGSMKKNNKVLTVCGVILITCCLLLMIICSSGQIPYYLKEKVSVLSVVGFLVGLCFFFFPSLFKQKKSFIKIYKDHVEGVQISPYVEFSLTFEQIYNVRKMNILTNEYLIIDTADKNYTVFLDDVSKAYFIINNKLDALERVEGENQNGND